MTGLQTFHRWIQISMECEYLDARRIRYGYWKTFWMQHIDSCLRDDVCMRHHNQTDTHKKPMNWHLQMQKPQTDKMFFFSLLHHWKFPPSSSLHNLSIFYVFNHSWCVGFCASIVMFYIVLNHHNLCMHSLKRIDRGKNQREIGKQTRKKSIIIDLSRKKAGWWSTVMYVTDINYWNAAFFLLRIKPCKKCQQSKPTQYHYQ